MPPSAAFCRLSSFVSRTSQVSKSVVNEPPAKNFTRAAAVQLVLRRRSDDAFLVYSLSSLMLSCSTLPRDSRAHPDCDPGLAPKWHCAQGRGPPRAPCCNRRHCPVRHRANQTRCQPQSDLVRYALLQVGNRGRASSGASKRRARQARLAALAPPSLRGPPGLDLACCFKWVTPMCHL